MLVQLVNPSSLCPLLLLECYSLCSYCASLKVQPVRLNRGFNLQGLTSFYTDVPTGLVGYHQLAVYDFQRKVRECPRSGSARIGSLFQGIEQSIVARTEELLRGCVPV